MTAIARAAEALRVPSADAASPTLDGFLAGVERRALRIAELHTRDRDEALDLVQDAMLRLAQRYAQRAPADWPPLFHCILDNRIRDWRRRQAVKSRLLFWRSDEDADDPVDSAPDTRLPAADAALMQSEALRRLESALRRLPPRQAQAFVLRVWEGLSVEDTARAMGCSGGSVKTHLHRALAALRAELQDTWP